MFWLSRAISGAERDSSENLVIKIVSLFSSASCHFPGGLQSELVLRRARIHVKRKPAFYLCVRENRNRPWTDHPACKGRTLEARVCHTLPVRQSAHCLLAIQLQPLPVVFDSRRPGHSRRVTPFEPSLQTESTVHANSPGGRLTDIRCRGLGKNLCQANLPV